MTNMARVRVEWTGLTGLPGLSTFYLVPSAVTDVSAVVAFFNGMKTGFPNGLSWTIPNSGDVISDTTGALVGSWSATGGGTVAATGGTGVYAAGTGARIVWGTNDIVGGRRLRGSTFLCPVLGGVYDSSGTIDNTARASMESNAATFFAAVGLYIWHRPDPGGSNGSSGEVTSATIPDRVTSLRSRRT